ncbi:MAG: DUF501 domain-containing protein [Synergistaceae bacterium]|nr:DUF501 domain-containing protein [Synergistaceae bacterium]
MTLKTVSPGGKRLLFFYEKRRPSDIRVIQRQMSERKFDPALILGTANRCRFGCPRAVVCSPLSGGVPFPTSFWLTCPWLARHIGNVESSGGVGELEQWLENHARGEWLIFEAEHRLARMALLPPAHLKFLRRFKPAFFDRLRRGGAGGIRHSGGSPIRVKCIHLQTASWLAFRRHPGEEWLKARGIGQDCAGVRCCFSGAPKNPVCW